MNNEIIQEKLKNILNNGRLMDANIEIGLDTKLNTVLNSITFIKFIVAVEQEFDIEFEDEDLVVDNIDDFSDIVSKINEFISAKS